jgi:hypothetical protein
MIYGRIWVTGSSMMIMINTQFPEDPVVSDTAIVFVAAVDGPSTASTGDTVAVLGSAWITPGPYHPYDFGAYRLYYRITDDTAWTPVHEEQYIEVHRDTLGFWNTVGLEPALYDVRLVLKDDVGDSVEALKQIMLTNTGQFNGNGDSIASDGIVLYQEGHRAFRIITSVLHDVRIYDILGREITRIAGQETVWLAPASGVYFIKDTRGVLSRKLVAF